MNLIDAILTFAIGLAITLLGLVITGFLGIKFIMKKIMANEDVQDILRLMKEGKEALKDILENQNHDK